MATRRYAVFLRGVMPVGKNKVPMATLRHILADAGFPDPRTIIQTGNILLATPLSPRSLAETVRRLIKENIGPDLSVLVRDSGQIDTILEASPYGAGYDPARVFYVMFEKKPPKEKVTEVLEHDYGDEEVVIDQLTAYLYIPGTYGKGGLSAAYLEKKLGIAATMRNGNTLRKVRELMEE